MAAARALTLPAARWSCAARREEDHMRRRIVVMLAGVVLSVATSGTAFSQGQMQRVPLDTIKWVPCDPKATDPEAWQCASLRGDPAKEPFVKMVKAKAGLSVPLHWHTSNENL